MSALLPFIRLAALLPLDDVFVSGHGEARERHDDFVRDYARDAGFRVGSGGEWIAEPPVGMLAPKRAA